MFDTNYHYIVPEFKAHQNFTYFSKKAVNEYMEARREGFSAKPVLLGPVSFLLLGKEKEEGFHRLELLNKLLPVYLEVMKELDKSGASSFNLTNLAWRWSCPTPNAKPLPKPTTPSKANSPICRSSWLLILIATAII